jgi:hypothetical protein
MLGHINSKLVKSQKKSATTPTKNVNVTFDMPNRQIMVIFFSNFQEIMW